MNPPLMTDTAVSPLDAPAGLFDIRRALWHRHGRCQGDTDLFFAPDGEAPAERRAREAIALEICTGCPVQDICRDTGREQREIGVWGGETDEERAAAGYPPRNLSRRSVIRAARAGRIERAG